MKRKDLTEVFILVIILFIAVYTNSIVYGAKPAVTLTKGYLTVQAKDVQVDELFKEISRVCNIKVTAYDNSFPETLLSVSFDNVPLEQAIKKIIKTAGLKNYLIRYKENRKKDQIEELKFLSGSGRLRVFVPDRQKHNETDSKKNRPEKKRATYASKAKQLKEKKLEKQIEALDKKFTWDSEKTEELMKAVLRGAPLRVRKYAIDSMTNSINKMLKEKGDNMVNRDMIYKAVEQSVPADMPDVREKIKQYLETIEQ